MRNVIRLPTSLFLLGFLSTAACGPQSEEPDNARTLYEVELPAAGSPEEVDVAASIATLEVEGGVMFILGKSLFYLAVGAQTPVVVASAPRLHDSLTTDGAYVYFATQLPNRTRFDSTAEKANPLEPDGQLYRVRVAPPFAPEAISPVSILVGRIDIQNGHLFACESNGLNSEGALLDVPLDKTGATEHRRLRTLEYCRGVVADANNIYMLIDRSSRTEVVDGPPRQFKSGEQSLVLSVANRADAVPWRQQSGPTIVSVLPDTTLDAMYLNDGRISIVKDANAKVYTTTGTASGSFDGGRVGTVVPVGSGQWIWSKNSVSSAANGKICEGGRLYYGAQSDKANELTQNVCAARGLSVGTRNVLFIDEASLQGPTDRRSFRYRLKSLARPAP